MVQRINRNYTKGMITTELAHIEQLSEADVDRLYEIMRHAYAVTEVEIWGPNYTRMPKEEFRTLIVQEQIIAARLNEKLVGSIYTYPLTDTVWAFGLFSADFAYKGLGIGRALIKAAELHAVNEANASCMELEILKPRDFKVPVKVALKEWYERLGYEFLETVSFEERKPTKAEKAKNFLVPCVFDCYCKDLK
ncbi:MAG: GNAT family N-acetyltransferase [Crocinitomicaceae bacterium]|nr:GNAT family N-acetyltransferase [Crocinitomicaceae bacterium]